MAEDFKYEIDIEDFSDLEIDLDTTFDTRYVKPPKSKVKSERFLKFSNAEKLANDIQIKKGNRYFVIINGSFYFGDFIESLIVEKKYKVKELTISTLSLNENNVDSLANLLNWGCVDKLNLIVSDFFFSHERHNLIPYLYQELDKYNRFQLAAAGTHCKTCQFVTECGLFIIIHGSANLRTSGNIEQICIEENKVLYDFNYKYQSKILDAYKTINKSVRNKKMTNLLFKK